MALPKRLANIRYTDEWIDAGISHVLRLRQWFPEHVKYPSQQARFAAQYAGFEYSSNALSYGNIVVIRPRQINTLLSKLYKRMGDVGRDRLHGYIKSRYLGISRRRVQEFLNNQEVHQLLLPVRRRKVSRAIVASRPMERWQADLVDVSRYRSPQNRNATFLLTVIDCFSKHAWVAPLTSKSARNVAAAMNRVLETAGGPRIVQTDNGSEFKQQFVRVLESHGVKHVRNTPFSPQTNGQIERFNGTLKRMIRAHMLRTKKRIFVPELPRFVSTYNSLPHTTTKLVPEVLHKQSYNKKAQQRIEKAAVKSVHATKRRVPELNVGDTVRIALFANNRIAKRPTNWSRDLYTVVSVTKPKQTWQSTYYELDDGSRVTGDRLQRINLKRLVK